MKILARIKLKILGQSMNIRNFFSYLYLSVLIDANECNFYGRVFKNNKFIKSINAKFTDFDTQNIDSKIIEFLNFQEKKYYEVYISLFFDDENQGALPTLNKEEFEKFGIKRENLECLNIDYFSIYSDKDAIVKAKNIFKKDMIDLLYSPIALLYYEIKKNKITEKTSLYLYTHKSSFALAIFSKQKMQFATFLKINENEGTNISENLFHNEDITDIDNFISAQENNEIDMQDFKSLDDLLDDDIFGEFEDLKYDINMPNSNDVDTSVAIFGRDMNMYRHILSAVKEFYNNANYDSNFIEEIIIFDNGKTSQTFLQYLQSELLVQTKVYQVNSLEIMNEIMQKEIEI